MVKFITDSIFLDIEKLLNYIDNFKYDEAYFFLIENAKLTDSNKDILLKEWVKALNECYVCNKRKEAIKLLETIKRPEILNSIDFRIYNSLMSFYIENNDKKNFLKYKAFLEKNIKALDDIDLSIRIYTNIANGLYTFMYYEKCLSYCERGILLANQYSMFNNPYIILNIIKIIALYYLNQEEKAEQTKNNFMVFLKFTQSRKYILLLQNELEKFHRKKVLLV